MLHRSSTTPATALKMLSALSLVSGQSRWTRVSSGQWRDTNTVNTVTSPVKQKRADISVADRSYRGLRPVTDSIPTH
jgi:hypothetical protein